MPLVAVITFDIVASADVKSSKLISAVTLLATMLPVTIKSSVTLTSAKLPVVAFVVVACI